MKKIEDIKTLELIADAISVETRIRIIEVLKKQKEMTLSELAKRIPDHQFATIQNHCRKLTESGIVEMKKEGGRYVVRLKKIPYLYIEEIK